MSFGDYNGRFGLINDLTGESLVVIKEGFKTPNSICSSFVEH